MPENKKPKNVTQAVTITQPHNGHLSLSSPGQKFSGLKPEQMGKVTNSVVTCDTLKKKKNPTYIHKCLGHH